jgi:hypothetical protein
VDAIHEANEVLRAKGYSERDLAVHPVPVGATRAILKGAKIVSPLSDEADVVLRTVRDVVPDAAELGRSTLRPGDLRARLAGGPDPG